MKEERMDDGYTHNHKTFEKTNGIGKETHYLFSKEVKVKNIGNGVHCFGACTDEFLYNTLMFVFDMSPKVTKQAISDYFSNKIKEET